MTRRVIHQYTDDVLVVEEDGETFFVINGLRVAQLGPDGWIGIAHGWRVEEDDSLGVLTIKSPPQSVH